MEKRKKGIDNSTETAVRQYRCSSYVRCRDSVESNRTVETKRRIRSEICIERAITRCLGCFAFNLLWRLFGHLFARCTHTHGVRTPLPWTCNTDAFSRVPFTTVIEATLRSRRKKRFKIVTRSEFGEMAQWPRLSIHRSENTRTRIEEGDFYRQFFLIFEMLTSTFLLCIVKFLFCKSV